MAIQLSDHFTYEKLLRFTLPSVVMVIFTSIYSVIDGLFVANFAGATPFAALNIVWPFIMIVSAFGFMLGSGGSALVAKTLGESHNYKANRIFSMLIYITITAGAVFAVAGLLLLKPILVAFGVEGKLLSDSMLYARILFPAVPALMLQVIFQSFTVTAERPKLGLFVTVFAGVLNFILDILFIVVWKQGLAGAAYATAASQVIGAVVPLLYFALPNKSLLHLGRTKLYMRALVKTCTNGASEFLTNISISLVGILYNYQMLRLLGEAGVIIYGIISYVNFIFLAAFIGYTVGCNPLVGFHYGAGNKDELKNLLRKSLRLIVIAALLLTFIAEVSAPLIAEIFIDDDDYDLLRMTVFAFRIYAVSFLLSGFNIYASGFFTALNNGLISAVISFSRTMIFECLCVLFLPLILGVNGIWLAITVAEIMALCISIFFIKKMRGRYGY